MTEHPLCPTDEQLAKWESDWFSERENADVLLIQAFQAGADAELEACRQYVRNHWWGFVRNPDGIPTHRAVDLLWARRPESRPKPPSLKQQAWRLLETYGTSGVKLDAGQCETIRRALEALPDD